MDYQNWKNILKNRSLPLAAIDLDAVDTNAQLLFQAPFPNMRIASKSIRHPKLLRYLLSQLGERAQGLMCYSAREAVFLFEQGFDNFLIAYPNSKDIDDLQIGKLVQKGAQVIQVVDQQIHLEILSEVAKKLSITFKICLDIDLSWKPLGLHLGVRRSPIRSIEQALQMGGEILKKPELSLMSILAYEAQVAGLRDEQSFWMKPVLKWIKRNSIPLAAERRQAISQGLRQQGHPIVLVNGGGTGSLFSTSSDPSVTEVTAGSGFLCPHLFDGYFNLPLKPACFFAVSITRSSDPKLFTCQEGGYIASGSAGTDRWPKVHLPTGLSPLDLEGWGEVQTPLLWSGIGQQPAIGDPIIARPAKSGELAERFNRYLLLRNGKIEEESPTYRGLGFD